MVCIIHVHVYLIYPHVHVVLARELGGGRSLTSLMAMRQLALSSTLCLGMSAGHRGASLRGGKRPDLDSVAREIAVFDSMYV